MNSSAPNEGLDEGQTPPETLDRFERRRRRREERIASRTSSGWIAGIVFIAAGALILLQNLGAFTLNNWWALFILIPALGAFGTAWRAYQDAGRRLTPAARSSLFGGLILSLVSAVFLFGLNWTILGPVLIILVGLGILLNTLLPG